MRRFGIASRNGRAFRAARRALSFRSLPPAANVLPSGLDASGADFRANRAEMALHISALRAALSRLLAAKIRDPALDLAGSPGVDAVVRLLRGQGFVW